MTEKNEKEKKEYAVVYQNDDVLIAFRRVAEDPSGEEE